MVTRHRQYGSAGVNPAPGFKPFGPFSVAIRNIDQITGMQAKPGIRGGGIGLAHYPGPIGEQGILGIAKIEKGKWRFFIRDSAKLDPFAPVIVAVADPVAIQSIGGQIAERHGVVIGRKGTIDFRFFEPQCFGLGLVRRFIEIEAGRARFDGNFQHCTFDRGIGAPGNRSCSGWIPRDGQNNAVRILAWQFPVMLATVVGIY
jgi:hypothetical protein